MDEGSFLTGRLITQSLFRLQLLKDMVVALSSNPTKSLSDFISLRVSGLVVEFRLICDSLLLLVSVSDLLERVDWFTRVLKYDFDLTGDELLAGEPLLVKGFLSNML